MAVMKIIPIFEMANNLGNIRYNPSNRWLGQLGNYRGFVHFKSKEYSVRALYLILMSYSSKYGLNTVSDIVSRYAPPFENDTNSYISFVSERLGVEPNEELDIQSFGVLIKLARSIIEMETGKDVDNLYLLECYEWTTQKSITKKLPSFLPVEYYDNVYIENSDGSSVSVTEYVLTKKI